MNATQTTQTEMPTADAILPRRRFLLVRNPNAGLHGRTLLGDVVARLAAAKAIVRIVSANSVADAQAQVEESLSGEAVDAVVAAGGDGTIRALAETLSHRSIPLGLIPVGTGNVMAREIGLLPRGALVVDTLLMGRSVTIHGSLANGQPFFLMAGIGFDGRIVHALNQSLKRSIGRAAYIPPILASAARPVDELVVEVDGKEEEANWVVAANSSHYGGAFIIAPDAHLDTPGLSAVLIRARSRAELLLQLTFMAMGKFERCRGVTIRPCTRLKAGGRHGEVPVEIDGDPFGTSPVRIEANGPKLDLIVPASFVSSHGALERRQSATDAVASTLR